MKFIRILLFFLFFQQLIIAQEFKHLNLTTNQGLPSSEVYSIIQDSKGYIWFATDHGVSRYDGKKLITYTIADGLPDNTIFRMCEDPLGRIWFASQSNELCYWDKGEIHSTPASLSLQKILKANHVIKGIYIDSAYTIWINATNVSYFSEAKSNYLTFNKVTKKFAGVNNYELIALNKKVVYLNWCDAVTKGDKSLYSFKIRARQQNSYDHYYDYSVTTPLKYDNLGGGITKDGDFLFSGDSTLYIFSKGKVIQKNFKKNIIKIVTDPRNGIWVCYLKGGVDYFRDADFAKKPVSLLTNYSVDDVCMDHEGGVWAATLENGAYYMPTTSVFIYPTPVKLNDHIIYLDAINDTICVNTFGNNYFRVIDQKFNSVDWITKAGETKGTLYYIKKIRDTTYYCFSKGILRLDSKGKPIPYPMDPATLGFYGAKLIVADKNGSLWMASGAGLRLMDLKNYKIQAFTTSSYCASAMAIGHEIFVATKKGLYLFKDGKYKSLDYISPLLKSPIISFDVDKDSTMWIATKGNGVLRLKDKQVTQINKKNGLVSNICTSISIDHYGNVWVGTNNGLSCILQEGISKNKWSVKNITEQTGLNSNDITKVYAFKEHLWVGTMGGMSSVNIKDALTYNSPSPAHIDSIKVNNVTIKDKNIFPYNENNLTFLLDGLTFKDNGNHRYRYRLIGLDSSWQQINSEEILISNLAPGNYTFQVQVANADNIWSNNSSTYSFTIEKPFWLTWWFILSEVILFVILVYLIILWRTNIIQKKENEKLRINKLLAEYQMKALTAQMNPHFIFNAINSIQNFIIQNHATLAYDYLIKFSKLIRLVLNNSKDNEISLKQELDTLGLYIELEQLRFEKAFTFNLQIEPQIDQESLMIPALLLQPYIENAIWHGLMPLKARLGIITLTIVEQDNCLKITISDNGVGRKASDQIKKKIVNNTHQSVGMELTGKRIELFGQDSKFSLQIIDNFNETEEPTGTTVEIILPMIELY